jgi:hypothetical protein
MTRTILVCGALAAMLFACGEDKNYGDPIDDPNAPVHASAAITNTQALTTDTTNDTALNALNGLSGNMNILGGVKLQQEQGTNQSLQDTSQVDEACVDQTDTSITYTDCDYAGTTVNGSVSRNGSDISIDVEFVAVSEDTTQTTTADGQLTVTDTELTGYVDFDIDYDLEETSFSASLDGNFDVVLSEGCAVGGEMEVHGTTRANGFSQSVWVKAEYGPACMDVVVR